jgi:hypothetical protein
MFMGFAPAAIYELYQVAFERAKEAARPSRYELAMNVLPN